jgi:hypothetical protein
LLSHASKQKETTKHKKDGAVGIKQKKNGFTVNIAKLGVT